MHDKEEYAIHIRNLKQTSNHFNYITKQNIRGHNPNWPQNPNHPHKMFIIEGFESGNPDALLHSINHTRCINKIYLYAKDPYEPK